MTELSTRDQAVRLLTLRVVKDWVAAEERDLRTAATGSLVTGERVPGVLDPTDPDSLLGFVQKVKGRESVVIADREAFMDWVCEHCPGELVEIPAKVDVRSSFVAAVTAAVKKDGGWPDPATGELMRVPGVESIVSEPTLTVKPTAEADGLIRDALASRRIALGPPRPPAPLPSPEEQAQIDRFGIFEDAS